VIQRVDLPDDIAAGAAAGAVPHGAVDAEDLDAPEAIAAELSGDQSLKDIVRAETSRVERELIVKALDETGGNVTQAAKLLKISRKSLQMKMKEFGLRDRES
jgi:DNA-binding NtrC family response regulator